MSRLQTIRANLASLRWSRQTVRFLAAMAAVVIAALVALAVFFLLDVAFERLGFHTSAGPRLVLLVLAGLGVVWAFRQYAAPLLAVEETDLDMALMVERQQQIDSDLVAALQFETPEAKQWGSTQLEGAVVDYVSEWGNGLDVYQGFDRSQLTSRAIGFGAGALLWLLILVVVPGYVAIFFQRAFLLSSRHYPSAPVIESVRINGREAGIPIATFSQFAFPVKQVESVQDRPAPYGEPLVFEVRASGHHPAEGLLVLRSRESGHVTQIKLERQQPAAKQPATKPSDKPKEEKPAGKPAEEKAPAETPAAPGSDKPAPSSSAPPADSHEEAASQPLPSDHGHSPAGDDSDDKLADREDLIVYRGVLPRLLDSVSFQLFLGDAWTNASEIAIVPLPVVKPLLEVVPPKYARNAKDQEVADPTSLQRSVLEGSEVRFTLTESTKPLQSASFTLIASPKNVVIPLVPDVAVKKGEAVPGKVAWRLPAKDSPLARISEPVRFEVQVVDQHGMSLEAPLRGSIRLRADRKPQISVEIVHKVVVPNAAPLIGLRLRDDYGIRQVKLNVKTVHPEAEKDPVEHDYTLDVTELAVPVIKSGAPNLSDTGLRRGGTGETRAVKLPIPGDQLPLAGTFRVPLASYKLQKGDQLKLTFEAIDDRGELPGEASPSETLVLEVTDVSGVLAAIAEGDERSEKGLTDITNLQLGIGAQK